MPPLSATDPEEEPLVPPIPRYLRIAAMEPYRVFHLFVFPAVEENVSEFLTNRATPGFGYSARDLCGSSGAHGDVPVGVLYKTTFRSANYTIVGEGLQPFTPVSRDRYIVRVLSSGQNSFRSLIRRASYNVLRDISDDMVARGVTRLVIVKILVDSTALAVGMASVNSNGSAHHPTISVSFDDEDTFRYVFNLSCSTTTVTTRYSMRRDPVFSGTNFFNGRDSRVLYEWGVSLARRRSGNMPQAHFFLNPDNDQTV